MRNALWLLVGFLCVYAATVWSEEKGESKLSPMGFPYQQQWTHEPSTVQFQFTGESQRKLLFLRIYDVAHYIDAGALAASADQILGQVLNRQLYIKYQHDISASRLRSVLYDGFELNSTPAEWEQIQMKVDKLIAKINRDANSGDEMIIRWLADDRVMFYLNGLLIAQTQHRVFGKVLWSIWLGPQSVVKRNELLASLQSGKSVGNGN